VLAGTAWAATIEEEVSTLQARLDTVWPTLEAQATDEGSDTADRQRFLAGFLTWVDGQDDVSQEAKDILRRQTAAALGVDLTEQALPPPAETQTLPASVETPTSPLAESAPPQTPASALAPSAEPVEPAVPPVQAARSLPVLPQPEGKPPADADLLAVVPSNAAAVVIARMERLRQSPELVKLVQEGMNSLAERGTNRSYAQAVSSLFLSPGYLGTVCFVATDQTQGGALIGTGLSWDQVANLCTLDFTPLGTTMVLQPTIVEGRPAFSLPTGVCIVEVRPGIIAAGTPAWLSAVVAPSGAQTTSLADLMRRYPWVTSGTALLSGCVDMHELASADAADSPVRTLGLEANCADGWVTGRCIIECNSPADAAQLQAEFSQLKAGASSDSDAAFVWSGLSVSAKEASATVTWRYRFADIEGVIKRTAEQARAQ
jgi:hypothetical protein